MRLRFTFFAQIHVHFKHTEFIFLYTFGIPIFTATIPACVCVYVENLCSRWNSMVFFFSFFCSWKFRREHINFESSHICIYLYNVWLSSTLNKKLNAVCMCIHASFMFSGSFSVPDVQNSFRKLLPMCLSIFLFYFSFFFSRSFFFHRCKVYIVHVAWFVFMLLSCLPNRNALWLPFNSIMLSFSILCDFKQIILFLIFFCCIFFSCAFSPDFHLWKCQCRQKISSTSSNDETNHDVCRTFSNSVV